MEFSGKDAMHTCGHTDSFTTKALTTPSISVKACPIQDFECLVPLSEVLNLDLSSPFLVLCQAPKVLLI
jgi:hypothetical protein